MLESEIEIAGRLVHPALPEAIDKFVLPDRAPALVYSLVGQGRDAMLLSDHLAVGGFLNRERDYRKVNMIAEFMRELAVFTEELWQAGFVHANLDPEHVYYMQHGGLRVTGLSALCRSEERQIRHTEYGLRNVTLAYHSLAHARAAAGRSTDPLDAARVRWYAYSVLALELLWGRSPRGWCREQGHSSFSLHRDTVQAIRADAFPLVQWDMFQPLWNLLRACLSSAEDRYPVPIDAYAQFMAIWEALEGPKVGYRVGEALSEHHADEVRSRTRVRGDCEVVVVGNETHAAVPLGRMTAEYTVIRPDGLVTWAQGRCVRERREMSLWVAPSERVLVPGDVVPVEPVQREPFGLRLADWARIPGPAAAGDVVRALSMGFLTRAFDKVRPWVLTDVDGFMKTLPVLPASDSQRHVVYPRAGEFFFGRVRCSGSTLGLVPIDPPSLAADPHKGRLLRIRAIVDNLLYLDLPVDADESYLATCVLPLSQAGRREYEPGGVVPVRVISVDESIRLQYDAALAGDIPAVGDVYDARFERWASAIGGAIFVSFGEHELLGKLGSGSWPWGLPVAKWQRGQPIRVRVVLVENAPRYHYYLEYADSFGARTPEVVFPVGSRWKGEVLGGDANNLFLRLASGDAPRCCEVVGRLNRGHLPRQRLDVPVGGILDVSVMSVEPQVRRVELAPVGYF